MSVSKLTTVQLTPEAVAAARIPSSSSSLRIIALKLKKILSVSARKVCPVITTRTTSFCWCIFWRCQAIHFWTNSHPSKMKFSYATNPPALFSCDRQSTPQFCLPFVLRCSWSGPIDIMKFTDKKSQANLSSSAAPDRKMSELFSQSSTSWHTNLCWH